MCGSNAGNVTAGSNFPLSKLALESCAKFLMSCVSGAQCHSLSIDSHFDTGHQVKWSVECNPNGPEE